MAYTDKEKWPFYKKVLDLFSGAEIKCKTNEPVFTMQHKFCLVDDRILMTGTLNWGNDRSCDHWNYVYITSKQQLVEPVKKEFYKMWDEFSSNIHCDQTPRSIVYDSDTETIEIKNPDENTDDSEDFETVMEPQTIVDTELTPDENTI